MTNAVRSVLFLALVTSAACGKKKDEPATAAKPVATEATPAANAAPASTPPAKAAGPALSSNVALAVDPDQLFAPKATKVDLSGPAIVWANEQPGGEWIYDITFYAPGVKADCDTKLRDFAKPIDHNIALSIDTQDRLEAPKDGIEVTGKFEIYFSDGKGGSTTAGLIDGAKVKLSKFTDKTVNGELSGSSGTGQGDITAATGSFTAQLCGDWPKAPEPKTDDNGE
ncbi:MAG TPA: hypothetical protein VGM39_24450 [Kofleriaceae bacterium]|jgi:hypothetical protein